LHDERGGLGRNVSIETLHANEGIKLKQRHCFQVDGRGVSPLIHRAYRSDAVQKKGAIMDQTVGWIGVDEIIGENSPRVNSWTFFLDDLPYNIQASLGQATYLELILTRIVGLQMEFIRINRHITV
jgi:hypothetical protein